VKKNVCLGKTHRCMLEQEIYESIDLFISCTITDLFDVPYFTKKGVFSKIDKTIYEIQNKPKGINRSPLSKLTPRLIFVHPILYPYPKLLHTITQ